MNLRISPISEASPDMDDAQFNELVEDIRARGQLVAIWVSADGEVIDGRKRLRACELLNIEAKTVNVSDGDGADLARSLNILRTHYTASQRAMFAAEMANLKVGDVKSQRNQENSTAPKNGDRKISIAEAAAATGVSSAQVSYAKEVRSNASPEIIAAVESGKLSIKGALDIMALSKEDQPAASQERINPPVDEVGRRPSSQKGMIKASPKRPLEWRMARTLEQLEIATESVFRWLDEDGANEHQSRDQWLKRIARVRTNLSRGWRKHGSRSSGQDAIDLADLDAAMCAVILKRWESTGVGK